MCTKDINYQTLWVPTTYTITPLCTKRISSFVAKHQAFPLTPFPTHPTQGYFQWRVTERQKRKNVKFIKRKMAQILNQQYHPSNGPGHRIHGGEKLSIQLFARLLKC